MCICRRSKENCFTKTNRNRLLNEGYLICLPFTYICIIFDHCYSPTYGNSYSYDAVKKYLDYKEKNHYDGSLKDFYYQETCLEKYF